MSKETGRVLNVGFRQVRVDTVHGAKGETLDAVLYITTKTHLEGMLAGTGTEIGRIGYVAVTRPRDLLWVGVPLAEFDASRPRLEAAGLSTQRPRSGAENGRQLTFQRAALQGPQRVRSWPCDEGRAPDFR